LNHVINAKDSSWKQPIYNPSNLSHTFVVFYYGYERASHNPILLIMP
jgi:hypothetical protein